MATFKERVCKVESCNTTYKPKGPASKYCDVHSKLISLENSRKNTQAYRIRNNMIEKPGVGKGGNNAKGIKDSQYVSGIASFQTEKRVKIKSSAKSCNRCDKDLTKAGRYHWCVHHIDHDRTNNEYDNLELLCKRCHQIEHDCHQAFKRVETIEKTL